LKKITDLTLIIPTKNRPEFIFKILDYYKKNAFTGKIIIADSSSNKNYNVTRKIIRSFKLDISLYNHSGYTWQAIKKISSRINTEFCIYTGDDDFLVISTVLKVLEKLKKNHSFSGFCGESLIYSTKLNKNLIQNLSNYKQKKYDQVKLDNRISSLINDYSVPHFSIMRSEIFKKFLTFIPLKNSMCPIRHYSDEYLITLLFIASGRIGKINDLMLIRLGHTQKWSVNHINQNKNSKKDYQKSIQFVLNAFFNFTLNNKLKLNKERLTKQLLEFFPNKDLDIQPKHKPQLFSFLIDSIKSNINFYYNIKIGSIISSYQFRYDADKIKSLRLVKKIIENKMNY